VAECARCASLRSLVAGGISFATPEAPNTDPAKDGTKFVLHDKPQKEWLAGDEAVIYPAFRVTQGGTS